MSPEMINFFVGLVGLIIGIVVVLIANSVGISKSKTVAKQIVKDAESKADSVLKEATLEAKEKAYEVQLTAEKEAQRKQEQLIQWENKLLRKEDALRFKENEVQSNQKKWEDKNRSIDDKMANLHKMEESLQKQRQSLQMKQETLEQKLQEQTSLLEKMAQMSQADAKAELMAKVESQSEKEIGAYLRDRMEEAEDNAQAQARNIIAQAIHRYSQEEVIERTVSTVTLPNEEMKGRIIGREGRNIRAIEQATGVDLIIDDTPDVITLSCYNPIRREVARQAMEILLKDGRIQPGRIEEVVEKVQSEMENSIFKIGNEAVYRLGVGKMNRELIKLVGRMRYRYSYGQNGLQHSEEVARFAGMMAAELGLNQVLAKRAGLLHDIGKALDFEQEGSHVELGAKVARKYGEHEIVVNAIESHHGDVAPTDIISVLVAAADTISAARPGARYESVEGYITRLENLEKIATSYKGVEKAYAIQAGRELRIMVQPEVVDDVTMVKVAHDIKDQIEKELTYPGQIKVTLIREVRAQELAK